MALSDLYSIARSIGASPIVHPIARSVVGVADISTLNRNIKSSDLTNVVIIGNGGYGVVYKADHPGLGKVAYKRIHGSASNKELDQLMNEAKIQSSLDHPNIIRLLGLVCEPTEYGIVLEFMEHGDMTNFFQKNRTTWKERHRMMCDVASGMSYLHSQTPPIIHGDLKIQNILVGDDLRAKVCDFGFSQVKNYSRSKSTNQVRSGTITHIPPESWENSYLRKSESFDVYSFGILQWEIMTLEKPFEHVSPSIMLKVLVEKGERPDVNVIKEDVSRSNIELMKRCWSQDPKERPTFADIDGILKKELITEKQFTETESVGHWSLEKPVQGITWLEDKIYVTCFKSSMVHVFPRGPPYDNFSELDSFEVKDMKTPVDVISCHISNSILISDCHKENACLWMIKMPRKEVRRIWIDGQPLKMSALTSGGMLMVVEKDCHRFLDIYNFTDTTNDVNLVKRISISLEKRLVLRHAVQLSNTNLCVLYQQEGKPEGKSDKSGEQGTHIQQRFAWTISEISKDGEICPSNSFDILNERQDCWLMEPWHMEVDDDDNIFIADWRKDEVIIINPHVTSVRHILSRETHGITAPRRLCLIREDNVLMVGQGTSSSGGQISLFKLY